MARRLIGTAVTDSNGKATITYTGTGAGQLNVVAESGTFVSQPTSVLDCLYYDDCSSANHNTDWFNRNNLSTDYTDDVLKLTGGANTGNYMPNLEGTATSISDVIEWIPPFVFEYDLITFDDGTKHSVGVSSVGRNYSQLGLSNSSEHHIKVVYNGSKVYIYLDNSDTATYSADLTTNPVCVNIGVGASATQTIKDVKIYPLKI